MQHKRICLHPQSTTREHTPHLYTVLYVVKKITIKRPTYRYVCRKSAELKNFTYFIVVMVRAIIAPLIFSDLRLISSLTGIGAVENSAENAPLRLIF